MKSIRLAALILPLIMLAACDNNGSGSSVTSSVFAVTTSALPPAVEGVGYSAQLSTSNGVAPITFSWASGYTPPAWLSLSATGDLSGVAPAAASLSLQVQAADSSMGAATATRTLSLQVYDKPEITTTSLPRGTKGQAYSEQLTHDANTALGVTFALASGTNLPAGFNLSAGGLLSGTTNDGGLYPLKLELLLGATVIDTSTLDLVVYASIPYTYVEDALEPNDDSGTATQLLPAASPPGNLTMGAPAVQTTPLSLNSDQNISKPDGDDWFTFSIAYTGTITIDVFFRGLVGEVDAYLWFYTGSPNHQVVKVAESLGSQTDDEHIVLHNAQLSNGIGAGHYYLQINAPADASQALWNRNAYTFRVSFNDLTIATEQLDADSVGGSINKQLVAYNQGSAPTAPQWSIVAGALPNGVSFTTDGRFTGTPTEFGLYDFTVQVEDAGLVCQRDIKVRFFDSSQGDYWQVRGNRLLHDSGSNTDSALVAFGDAMVVAPHPAYPTEGAIYVIGGYTDHMLDMVRVFHTDRAGIPADKQFKFEDINKPLPNSLRYHGACFMQHSYGGYIYVIGGEIGAQATGHTPGDLWRSVFRLQVADGAGVALSHPLSTNWELLAELPDTAPTGENIKGWGEFGLAADDQANDADDRIYLLGGRYDIEDSVGSSTYSRKFHNEVLMYECPTSGAGSGIWFRKSDTSPYTPRRFPAVAMIGGYIYIVAGREGAVGQTGSGGNIADYVEMYQPDNFQTNAAVSTAGSSSFPTLNGVGGYYPMCATLNGSLYVWCGWDNNFVGTKALHRFDPNGSGNGGNVTRLTDADWGTGFGGGVAHDGKLWIISGLGHLGHSEPKNLVYVP